jgi:uncharacterized protein YoxC
MFMVIKNLNKLKQGVLELKETIGNLVRQLKGTNIEKDELLDENMKGKEILENHEGQIKKLLAT